MIAVLVECTQISRSYRVKLELSLEKEGKEGECLGGWELALLQPQVLGAKF
jgi:hypothetical protein